MFGKKLNEKVTDELEKRKRALDRSADVNNDFSGETNPFSAGGLIENPLFTPDYKLSEMMVKTTYARLISPRFKTSNGSVYEIRGRLLQHEAQGNFEGSRVNQVRDQLNYTYWNATSDERGYVPPPGITSIRTAYVGEGATINTIKEADITLRLYSLSQYNLIIPYFVRVGTLLYLEFGWSNPQLELSKLSAYPRNFMKTEQGDDGEEVTLMDIDAIQTYPDEFAVNTNGNSDILVGTVTNFDVKIQPDGGFEVNLSLKSQGYSMYHQPTYADSRANFKVVKNVPSGSNDSPFGNNLDERTAPMMLAKSKLLIQEDFNLKSVFSTAIDGDEDTSIEFAQPSYIYIPVGSGQLDDRLTQSSTGKKYIKKYSNDLKGLGFDVNSNVDSGIASLSAMHKGGDLMLTIYSAGVQKVDTLVYDSETGEAKIDYFSFGYIKSKFGDKKPPSKYKTQNFFIMRINYFPSVRYIEDNILSRLFGTADASGVINGGIRSLSLSKTAGYDFEGSDNPFISNKMLTHRILIPKNFNQVLINNEAMVSVLQRTGTGQFKSEGKIITEADGMLGTDFGGWTHKAYAEYSKSVGKILRKGLPFISEFDGQKNSETADDEIKNPNHVSAFIRHMYVNIELVQEAFLGSDNLKFCNRAYFPSSADVKKINVGTEKDPEYQFVNRNQVLDKDIIGSDELYAYFDDRGIRFNKESCAKTLTEGLYNMWNSISANFHNFPNFEIGANINLPNFLQVYDLRYTKSNEFYEFDVFNRNSILKSLELSSQIPTNVQLAATLGASTTFDFDSLVGGTNNGLQEDLLISVNKGDVIRKDESDKSDLLTTMAFEKSLYLQSYYKKPPPTPPALSPDEIDQFNAASTMTDEEFEAYLLDETPKSEEEKQADEEYNALVAAHESYVPGISDKMKNLKVLKLEKGENSTYAWYGLSPNVIAGTPEAIEEDSSDPDDDLRKSFPDLNVALSEMQGTLNKLFMLDNKGKLLYGGSDPDNPLEVENTGVAVDVVDENGEVTKVNPSVNLRTGEITIKDDKKMSFTTTYANFVKDDPYGRGFVHVEFGTHADYQAYLDYLIFQDEKESLAALNGTISYFELTFEIDGISGILPGEAFTISYLPDLIKDYFYFIVKNVEQTLGADGWTTTITALQRRKYAVVKPRNTLAISLQTYSRGGKKNIKPEKIPDDLFPKDRLPGDPIPEPDIPPLPDEGQDTEIPNPNDKGIVRFPPKTKNKLSLNSNFDLTLPPKFDPDELPKPPVNFVAYDIQDSPTAEIVLSYTDGQAQLTTTPGADEQQFFKIYPDGDKNNAPISFTLGVTDILSKAEYKAIINKYKDAFGSEGHSVPIEDVLAEQYMPMTISQPERGQGEINYGKWDEVGEIEFFVAKRPIGTGDVAEAGDDSMTVSSYIAQMIEAMNVIGDDNSERANSNAGVSSNFYADDIIKRILDQPQRTRLTVLETEKEEIEPIERPKIPVPSEDEDIAGDLTLDELDFETFDFDEPPPPSRANIVFVENEPDTNQEEEVEVKPKEPILSTYQAYYMDRSYGKEAWNQNHEVLYALCGGWGTKGAGYTKGGVYYGECRPDDPNLQNIAVPFKKRMEFWDEMIQKPNEGGKYDREKALQQMKKLKATGEFDKMKPNQTWTPQWSLPAGYNPDISRKAISWYKKKDDNKKLVNVGKTFYNDPNLD